MTINLAFRSIILLLLALCATSCGTESKESVYPSIVTEFAEVYANSDGYLYQIRPDGQAPLYLDNPIGGYVAHTTYRGVCGYTTTEMENTVHLYQMEHVTLLHDSTAYTYPGKDPLNAISVWDGGNYINFHLSVKTTGGNHYMGFRADSLQLPPRTNKPTLFVSLYHNQNGDPLSYSDRVYASLKKTDLLPYIKPGDSIRIQIHTFKGTNSWPFHF